MEHLLPGLYSPLVIIAAMILALGTANLLVRWQGTPASAGRTDSIDGLRGFLAFFVFLHHGSIWYMYIRTQAWTPPVSNLYRHLGDTSVALFFMITAFLFTTKVLDSRDRPVDWVHLCVGRVTRLFPLYAVAIAILFVMVAVLTGWTVEVPLRELAKQVVKWMTFTILGSGPVNGLVGTNELIAGVVWTLPYEWWFYASLPAIGLLLGRRSAWVWMFFGAANLLLFHYAWRLDEARLMPFLGGIVAAYAVKNEALRHLARLRWSGLIVLALLAATVTLTPTAYTPAAVGMLSVAFLLIACGNDLFGLLSSAASRMLGEMTYSIYLLHGLLLSFVFQWVVGIPELATWSVTAHWCLVLVVSIPLILVGYASHRWIEAPAQAAAPTVTAWLKRKTASLLVHVRRIA
jgi:peptidoglycan/LPS O-acetylase OafA/YrhL